MERKMFKEKRQTTKERAEDFLKKGLWGILAVNGDDGYPYAVPMNYIYFNGKIYLHSAKRGYKLDAIRKCDKVCFTAIPYAKVLPRKFTSAFESVVVFGKAKEITDKAYHKEILQQFIFNYSKDFTETGFKLVDVSVDRTEIIEIEIEKITGKENTMTD